MAVLKGYEGKFYIGDYGQDATTEVDTIRDLNVDRSVAEIDVAVRADAGEEAVDLGQRSNQVTVTMFKDTTDTHYITLRDYSINRTKFSIKVLDYEAGPGFLCDAVITGLQDSQVLNDPQAIDFTIKRTRGQALTIIAAA